MTTVTKMLAAVVALGFTACATEDMPEPYLSFSGSPANQDVANVSDPDVVTPTGADTQQDDVVPSPDTASPGTDVASTPDTKLEGTDGQGDTDTQADSTTDTDTKGKDADATDTKPVPLTCNTPASERLVPMGNGVWFDKLLGITCKPLNSEMGERCLPDIKKQNTKPEYGDIGHANRFFDPECTVDIYDVKDDGKPKFYLVYDGSKVLDVRGLKDVPNDNLYWKSWNGKKYLYLKGPTYTYSTVQGVKTIKTVPGDILQYGQDWTFKLDNGPATLPQCLEVTGLALFSTMP